MNRWILVCLFVVGMVVLLTVVRNREGFEDFLQFNTRFTEEQDANFQDKLDKQIYINPGLNVRDLNSAIFQPDEYLETTKDRDYTTYLAPDPYGLFKDRDTMCREARDPKDLPAREKRAITGCGWWFLPEFDRPSMGALGTIHSPINPSTLPSGGEWIWDIPTAVMREEMKLCRRITNCDMVTLPDVAGKCGFCSRLGYAVPILPGGKSKYPESQKGGCPEPTKTTIQQCTPPPPPIITPTGIDCKNLGRPSADNSIRIYTQAECSQLGGNYYPGLGECLMKQGGSFSAACSGLNGARASPRLCDPGPTGALSRECLISIATNIGYSKSGSILGNLYNNKPLSETDKQALSVLGELGITVAPDMLLSGRSDFTSIGDAYSKIFKAMTSAPTAVGKEAAKWLAVGTDNFNLCDVNPDKYGPFPLSCVQQEFRKAGCQAAGAAYPKTVTLSNYSSKQWNEVTTMFRDMYGAMKSTDPKVQDKAVKDCLGIDSYRPPKSSNLVCIVRNDYAIYSLRHSDGVAPKWQRLPGALERVAVSGGKIGGSNASQYIYFADSVDNTDWVNNSWGRCNQMSMDNGVVFCVNSLGNMYIADNGDKANPNWVWVTPGPGPAYTVCISDGKLYHANTGHGLCFANNYKNVQWQCPPLANKGNGRGPGAVYQIAADSGVVVVVSGGWGFQENWVWCCDNGDLMNPNWFQIKGPLMKWVSIKAGMVYAVGLDGTIYYKDNYKSADDWSIISGMSAMQIDVDRG